MSSFNNKTTDLHTSCTYYGKMETEWSAPSVIEFPPNYYSVVKAGDFLERIQNVNIENKIVNSKKIEHNRYLYDTMLEKLSKFGVDDIIVPIITNCGYSCFDGSVPTNVYREFNERCKSEQIDDNVNENKWRCHPIFIDIYLDKIMNKIDYDDDDDDDDDDDGCQQTIEFLSFEAFEANAWTLLEKEGHERILIDKVTIKSFKEKKGLFDVLQRIKNVVFDPEDGCNSQKIHCLKEILKGVEM